VRAWYPDIDGEGKLRPMGNEIRSLASTIAETLSPECPWDAEHFVIRGYFKKFGPLYSNEIQFPCRVAGTRAFFAENVHLQTQDGLLVIFLMDSNVG
jgi:hypothetical protein